MIRRICLLSLLMLVAGVHDAIAQSRTITGSVVDATTAQPLAGAQVYVPVGAAAVAVEGRTTLGTVTNSSGNFTLEVPQGEIALVARLIGYKRADVTVPGGQNSVDIALETDVLNLEEVVVTGQATSIARRNLANAVSTVSASELTKTPAQSVEQQLAGKIAGADIAANSGAPGGGLQINLRGVSTIIGSTTPLYVVDGVIVSDATIESGTNAITRASGGSFANGFASSQDNAANRIADLNPNDIQSVEVLKGASAAAIYGSKANNGVIIITTKKGQAGTPQFTLTQRFGTFDLANKLGLRQFESLEAAEQAFGPRAADFWAPGKYIDHEEELAGENPLSYETVLGVSGGTDDTRYYASGLVKHDGGIITGTYYDKQSIRLNLDQNFGTRVTAGINTNAIHSKTGRGFTNNDNRSISYWMTLPSTPTFVDLQRDADGNFPDNPFANSNPLETAAEAINNEEVWRFIGAADLRWDMFNNDTQGLSFLLNGGVDYFAQDNVVFAAPELQFEPLDGLPGTSLLGNSSSLNLNVGVNLVHTLTPATGAFAATTSVGVQYEDRDQDIARSLAQDLIAGQRNIDQATNIGVFQDRARTQDLGIFAQEELLLLQERLLLTAGVRADQSSNNAQTDELFVYPKFAASYRFPGLRPGLVDELKFRAAWGQSGNQPLYGEKFSTLQAANIGGLQTLRIPGNAVTVAQDLHPERQREVEGGLDAELFNSRARFEVTGYERKITELLLRRSLPGSTGYATAIFNGGTLRTRGVEVALEAVPVQTSRIQWTSRTTFSSDASEITELPVPPFSGGGFGTALGGFQIEEGKSPTQIVGRDTVAFLDDPRCLEALDVERGSGQCTVGTRIVTAIGDANPDFRLGFSNDVQFGAFSLYGLIDWQRGGDVVNLTGWLFDLSRNADDFTDPCVRNCATVEAADGTMRTETLGEQRLRIYPGRTSTVWLEDASYVKLRELTLSYELPPSLLQRFWSGARYVRLNLSGRNLLTFTDYSGMDPEVSNFGSQAIARNIDVAPYPPSRSFWFSVDLSF